MKKNITISFGYADILTATSLIKKVVGAKRKLTDGYAIFSFQPGGYLDMTYTIPTMNVTVGYAFTSFRGTGITGTNDQFAVPVQVLLNATKKIRKVTRESFTISIDGQQVTAGVDSASKTFTKGVVEDSAEVDDSKIAEILTIAEDEKETGITIPHGSIFVDALNTGLLGLNTEKTRQPKPSYVNQVLFEADSTETLNIATTDNKKLAVASLSASKEKSGIQIKRPVRFVVNSTVIQSVQDVLGTIEDSVVNLYYRGQQILIAVDIKDRNIAGQAFILTPVADDTFPDYKSVIPADLEEGRTIVSFDYYNMMVSVASVANVAEMSQDNPCLIEVTEDSILLMSQYGDQVSRAQAIPAQVAGTPVSVYVNISHLQDSLTYLSTGRINLSIGKPNDPIVFYSEDGANKYVIRPLRAVKPDDELKKSGISITKAGN